jgi:hypothetical protein
VELLRDSEKRKRLGEAARKFALENYSMEAAGVGTLALFDRLAEVRD